MTYYLNECSVPSGGDRMNELELMEDTGFLLSRSSGLAVRTTNAHLAPFGLRVRQFSVLSVACDRDGITQRELAEVLGLDPSQIVALVDELAAAGLVERRPGPRDRRARLGAGVRTTCAQACGGELVDQRH